MDEAAVSRRDLLKMLAALGIATSAEALAQGPAKSSPGFSGVILENYQVRVLEFRNKPGRGLCGEGEHTHPDHLTIVLTAAKVKVTMGGKAHVFEYKPGDISYGPADTHTTEIVSGKDVRVYIVEFKGKDWKPST